jgi:hypothetical protein
MMSRDSVKEMRHADHEIPDCHPHGAVRRPIPWIRHPLAAIELQAAAEQIAAVVLLEPGQRDDEALVVLRLGELELVLHERLLQVTGVVR